MSWRVLGHDWAVALLQRGLDKRRIAHAYLFTGPPQIGKTRLALALAQALNCAGPEPPCGECPSCLKIEQRAHPDVRLVVGEGVGESIKIDQIRALQREAVLSPYEARYRVFILRRIDLASIEAANSLLKTLEEPPEHVVLALTAVHAEELPSTVVSRCQRLDLRPAARDIVKDVLQGRGLPDDQSQLLAQLSGGRLGWALQACQDESLMSQRQRDLDQLVRLLSASRVERLDYATKASRDPDTSRALIELWIGWWRDMLLLCGQGERYLSNMDRIRELRSLAKQTTVSQAWTALRALQSAAAQLEANVNTRLALEGLLLKLPRFQPSQVDQGMGTSN